MFYIHQTTCISPQMTFAQGAGNAFETNGDEPKAPVDNLLRAIEPSYEGIPGSVLRRMSRSVKMGVGAALPLLQTTGAAGNAEYSGSSLPDGILIGTGNGGMEDSVKFLRQIIDFKEGVLAPGPFVQSTPNAIASQIGLLSRNKGYNMTHVHKGLAFENALTDAAMLLSEHPGNSYLVGGVDEICAHHYKFELTEGWYKKERISGNELYTSDSPGTIGGEGAAMFLLSNSPSGAVAAVKGMMNLHNPDEDDLASQLSRFLDRHLPEKQMPDLLLTGENGDSRMLRWYRLCESMMDATTTVARFKHLCGEYPTASAFGLWLACNLPAVLPGHLVKTQPEKKKFRKILIYNNYKSDQHSFMLLDILL